MTAPDGLTPRLRVVADLMCRGLSNAEIAHELGLSEHTIKNAATDLYNRMGVNSRGQAMSLWIKHPDERAAASLELALDALDNATQTVKAALVTVRGEQTE